MIIRILIIVLLFTSCSVNKNKINHDLNKHDDMINILSTKHIYDYSNNHFDVSIKHRISNNHFVFFKDSLSFIANILTTIQIYDINNDSIILQNSWKNNIVEKSYDDTRSSKKVFLFEDNINLISGDYNLKINIQDIDNKNVFKSEKKIILSTDNGFGEGIIYTKNNDLDEIIRLEEIDENINLEQNQIRLLFQYFQNQEYIDELILEVNDSNSEYSQIYSNLLQDKNGFYSIDFDIPTNYYGSINLSLLIGEHVLRKDILIEHLNNNFWTNDINEIIGVMRYILPISDIKLIKDMNSDDKMDYITNYWTDKDPDSTTQENELLIEFTNRVKFVNTNFSDLSKGWRSDRGRIYILYGEPERVESYSNQSDGIYEIWEYPSGIKFIFLDRNGFGNFILIRQAI